MRLKNTTNVPDARIKEIIEFVKPNGLATSIYDVIVRNGGGSGHFEAAGDIAIKYNLYPKTNAGIFVFPKRTRIFVTVDNHSIFPEIMHEPSRTIKWYWQQYSEKKQKWVTWHHWKSIPITRAYLKNHKHVRNENAGYLPCLILSKEEELVETLAHEFRHFWQVNHQTKRGKVWGARGIWSELDTCAYAIRKVREWRKLHAVDVYPEHPDKDTDIDN